MRKYAIGSAAIGAMQLVNAFALYSSNGSRGDMSLVFSIIEFLWTVVSFVVAIRIKHVPTRSLAFTFFAYNEFGWLLSALSDYSSAPVAVPMWFVVFGGFFAIAYTTGSVYVAKKT